MYIKLVLATLGLTFCTLPMAQTFQLKNRKSVFFVRFNTIYTIKKLGLPQMFAKINLTTLGPTYVTGGHTNST